jgi:hypothetical protein
MTTDDLDINNFQCPLCKTHSNCIIPPLQQVEALTIEEVRDISSKDPHQNLLNMYLDMINAMNRKIVGELETAPKDILVCDLPTCSDEIISITRKYINH